MKTVVLRGRPAGFATRCCCVSEAIGYSGYHVFPSEFLRLQPRRIEMLAHNVYFTLNDASVDKQEQLVAECRTYLKDHPGVAFFAAGRLAEGLDRPVNDRDFHVALHVIFTDRAAHDNYQVSESHQEFIARNKENWAQVRVFDSTVEG